MGKARGKIGAVLLVSGVLLMTLPIARWGVAFFQQRQALREWEAQNPVVEVTELAEEPASPVSFVGQTGLIEIPKINLRAVVQDGVSEEDLKRGPGLYPQSQAPTEGNVSIAAHRGVYGSWFFHLDKLVKGDLIHLTYDNHVYTYSVRESRTIESTDWSVIACNGHPELTLTTCLLTTNTKRLVVKADLKEVVERSP